MLSLRFSFVVFLAAQIRLGMDILRKIYRSMSQSVALLNCFSCIIASQYAELETALGGFPRTIAIFEVGASQSALAMSELLWKAFIVIEVREQGDCEKARSLYERPVGLSGHHHKLWISYAEFEGLPILLLRALQEEDEDEENERKMIHSSKPTVRMRICEVQGMILWSEGSSM